MAKGARMRKKAFEGGIRLRGMARVRITENGQIVGDSGWGDNLVTNLGVLQYLVGPLGIIAGSKQVSAMALGSGTHPGTAATALDNELTNFGGYARRTVSASAVGSHIVQFLCTFASTQSNISTPVALSNVAILNSTASGGTIFAGKTFTVSTWNTNQDVNITYQISFATTPGS